MSTGLDTSTVTPGSTAPDESCTIPVTVASTAPCARTVDGRATSPVMSHPITIEARLSRMVHPPHFRSGRCRTDCPTSPDYDRKDWPFSRLAEHPFSVRGHTPFYSQPPPL